MVNVRLFDSSNGKTLFDYCTAVIPRVGETVTWGSKIGFVKEIIHNINISEHGKWIPSTIFIYIEGIEEF